MKKILFKIIPIVAIFFIATSLSNYADAASIPNLTLTNNSSTVTISITGADPNGIVSFYFPNTSIVANPATGVTYTPISIGMTDSNGSFSAPVATNSYGLSGGISVYVSVDGANSSKVLWPATVGTSGQNGALSLSEQNVSLINGQTSNIVALNNSNTLAIQGNSNPSVASAYYQSNNNSVILTGLNTGSTVISICAGTSGCGSVNVTVQAPTQAITFSLPSAYVMVGQPAQTVSIYGPSSGSGISISNTDKNTVAASISGTTLSLQALAIGQVTVTVCATGYQCGSLTVNAVSSGTAIPNQVATPASQNANFNQSPQLSSLSISSNNVLGSFFGSGSTISINFSLNQTVSNVQAKIAGQQTNVSQGNGGVYYVSYTMTGNESLPLPVVLSYTNPNGLIGQMYFTIGNSAPASASVSTPVSSTQTSSSGSYTFTRYLYEGMTASNSSDADVYALQKQLKADGVYSGPITGYFGPLTKAGVQAFQTKHGLTPVGVVGPSTRALLNKGE